MSDLSLAIKTATTILRTLKSWLDPNIGIEESTVEYVLGEFPRIVAMIERRAAEIEASGCTHEEAKIIAYQVLEAQRRTLDEGKRRRLSNVLVNGLCAQQWQKATHRLMVRLAAELEEEHIDLLRHQAQPAAERRDQEWFEDATFRESRADKQMHALRSEQRSVEKSIERELVSRHLLEDVERSAALALRSSNRNYRQGDVTHAVEITPLGRMFLDYLRDPEPKPPED